MNSTLTASYNKIYEKQYKTLRYFTSSFIIYTIYYIFIFIVLKLYYTYAILALIQVWIFKVL